LSLFFDTFSRSGKARFADFHDLSRIPGFDAMKTIASVAKKQSRDINPF